MISIAGQKPVILCVGDSFTMNVGGPVGTWLAKTCYLRWLILPVINCKHSSDWAQNHIYPVIAEK